jgi:hypothetical protein
MSIRVPERALRLAFGAVLVLSGVKIVGMPQANLVIEVGVGVLVAAFLGWSVRELLLRRVAAQNAT